MIISKTPYRLPLSGGGSDIPYIYKKINGELISAAIDQFVYVFVGERKIRKDFFIQTSSNEFVKEIKNIKHQLVKKTLEFYKIKTKLHISTVSTVPTRTGLGTSSAMLIGLITCINKLFNFKLSKEQIYKDAFYIERKLCKLSGGWQDQIVSSYGGFLKIDINKKSIIKVKKKKVLKIKKIINKHFLLVYSNTQRDSSEVIKSQQKENKDNLIDYYIEIKKMNYLFLKYVESNNAKKIGNLFNEHWKKKMDTSSKMINKEIINTHKLFESSLEYFGSKLIGAGGGGFFLTCIKNKKNL